jgi:hypothetical protein
LDLGIQELKLNMAPLTAFLANSMSKVSFEDLKTQDRVMGRPCGRSLDAGWMPGKR